MSGGRIIRYGYGRPPFLRPVVPMTVALPALSVQQLRNLADAQLADHRPADTGDGRCCCGELPCADRQRARIILELLPG